MECHEGGRRGGGSPQTEGVCFLTREGEALSWEYLGIDWSYRRAAWCSLSDAGVVVGEGAVPADADGLVRLVIERGSGVRTVVEMMSGAIWVRDQLARGRLACAGRARPQGPRRRAARLQDRQGRRARARRALPPRPGARAVGRAAGGPRAARATAAADAPGLDARVGDESHLRASRGNGDCGSR
jgi:hypothetical protein